MDNIILATDSYKFTHHRQNPPWVKFKSSYIEARGGAFGYVVFAGLQKFLMDIAPVTARDIHEAREVCDLHMGPGVFNAEGWHKIREMGGQLPLEIEALDEGSIVPHGTPMVQVRNTKPGFEWLPAYVETAMLRAIWYPSTVATLSRECKKIILAGLEKTGTPGLIDFKLHDFGARGVSSGESAALGGFGHIINFKGTDTVEALACAKWYYGEPMAGFSIPAAEHSTITCWGAGVGQVAFIKNMIERFPDNKILAVVGDSWNIFDFCARVVSGFADQLCNSGKTLVVRPDSGEPAHVVVECLKILRESCGGALNDKGYWALPDWVRLIQGDGINMQSIGEIVAAVERAGFSIDNLAFGMGGALLQQVNRDTCKFAMKTSAMSGDGAQWHSVFKDPITDPGKASKRGIQGGMKTVWINGTFMRKTTLAEMRERAKL